MNIEKAVAAWGLKTLQEFVHFQKRLDQFGLTVTDIEHYIAEKRAQAQKNAIMERLVIQGIECPSCHKHMTLYPVNTNRGDRIDDKTKHSQWWCKDCDASIFNETTYVEESERIFALMRVKKEKTKKKLFGRRR